MWMHFHGQMSTQGLRTRMAVAWSNVQELFGIQRHGLGDAIWGPNLLQYVRGRELASVCSPSFLAVGYDSLG